MNDKFRIASDIRNLVCTECSSDDIHTAFCDADNHNVHCMSCDHCWFDQDTQDYWDRYEGDDI